MQLYHSGNTSGCYVDATQWSCYCVFGCGGLRSDPPAIAISSGWKVCCSLTTATQGSSLSVPRHYTSCHDSLKRKNINNVVKHHGTTHSRTHSLSCNLSLTLVKIIYLSCTRSIPLPRHINCTPAFARGGRHHPPHQTVSPTPHHTAALSKWATRRGASLEQLQHK